MRGLSRRWWRLAVVVVCAFGASTGCAVKSAVHAYAEPGANLDQFRDYTWGAADPTTTGDPRLDRNEIFEGRVQAAVDRQLAARGLERATSGTSDLVVHYHATVHQRIDLSDREPFDPCATCKPFIYDAGTLVIDLVDAKSGKVLWRGWSEGNVDGVVAEQRWLEARIEEDVTRMFRQLPPVKTAKQ